MRGALPALITAILLATAWADSTEAKQWRCVTEKKVGAKLSKDLKPTEFYVDDEEFRVMDRESVLELYKIDPSTAFFDDHMEKDFLIRRASRDPRVVSSWLGLDISGGQEGEASPYMYASDLTKTFLGGFDFDVQSGRFQFTQQGTYAWKGPEEGDDAAFSFGTYRPYYD